MDIKMAQTCMAHGIAVMHAGRRYYRINAITSRKYVAGEAMDARAPRMYAELYDGIGNSVRVVPVDELTLLHTEGSDSDAADGNVHAPASGRAAGDLVERAAVPASDVVRG